jgi:hypothetical protein
VPALKVLPPPSIAVPGAASVVPATASAVEGTLVCATALVNGVCPPAAND